MKFFDILLYGCIINAVSAIIFSVLYYKRRKTRAICLGTMILFLPGLGWFMFALSELFTMIKLKRTQYDITDLITHSEVAEMVRRPDLTREMNMVPLSDAAAISQNTDKRTLYLDLLKIDLLKYSKYSMSLLNDRDSETAHYAAAAIMESVRKMRTVVKNTSQAYRADKSSQDKLFAYLDALINLIDSGLLSIRETTRFEKEYVNIAQEKLFGGTTIAREADYVMLIHCFIKQSDLDKAEGYGIQFVNQYEIERAYILLLSIYYLKKDAIMLQEYLNKLIALPIELSVVGMNLVNFWREDL